MIRVDIQSAIINYDLHRKDGPKNYCVLKSCGNELRKIQRINDSRELIWNESITASHSDINELEKLHNRPYFLEYLEIDIYRKNIKLYETRIPLTNLEKGKRCCKLHRPQGSEFEDDTLKHHQRHHNPNEEIPRIYLSLTCLDSFLKEKVHHSFDYLPLSSILSPSHPLYHHLFIHHPILNPLDHSKRKEDKRHGTKSNKDNSEEHPYYHSHWSSTYRSGLPMPMNSERMLDVYPNVEWKLPCSYNAFGDRIGSTTQGLLILTDLRIMFLPSIIRNSIAATSGMAAESNIGGKSGAGSGNNHSSISSISSLKMKHASSSGGGSSPQNRQSLHPSLHPSQQQHPYVSSPPAVLLYDPTITSHGPQTISYSGAGYYYHFDHSLIEEIIASGSTISVQQTSREREYTPLELLYYHRYCLSIPLGSVATVRSDSVNTSSLENTTNSSTSLLNPSSLVSSGVNQHNASFIFELFDRSTIEFLLTSSERRGRVVVSMRSLQSMMFSSSGNNRDSLVDDIIYRSGLAINEVSALVWTIRVMDLVLWWMRIDSIWMTWFTCMQQAIMGDSSRKQQQQPTRRRSSMMQHTTTASLQAELLQQVKHTMNLEHDYSRMTSLKDGNWRISYINTGYALCKTYPSTLVFPGVLQDEEIRSTAKQRSSGRLPAMMWIHPFNKASLCRAAQPLAGLSGLMSLDYDKRLCLAIKNACPTNLPLRIADARPKLNANANAMQGKGFESISNLGGSANATLVFLDIENIHVVRNSLIKAKEALLVGYVYAEMSNDSSNNNNNNNNSNHNSSYHRNNEEDGDDYGSSNNVAINDSVVIAAMTATGANDISYYNLVQSKWCNHISTILKGAVGMADSLMQGYPVLVHCSDG